MKIRIFASTMEKKLSLIVPVYNVKAYLARCLDSLLRQGMETVEGGWEVICVDDGSTDGCAEILREYAERHADVFRVVRQENQGLWAARNTGLTYAQGEYVAFVDSDDLLVDGAYGYLCTHMLEGKPDVVQHQCEWLTEGLLKRKLQEVTPEGGVIFEGTLEEAYSRGLLITMAWSMMLRRDFMERNHLVFRPVRISEDILFCFDLAQCTGRIRQVSSKVYLYFRDNSNSIMQTHSRKVLRQQIYTLFDVHEVLQTYADRHEGTPMAAAAFRKGQHVLQTIYKKALLANLTRGEWLHMVKRAKEVPPYRLVMDETHRLDKLLYNNVTRSFLGYKLCGWLYRGVLLPYRDKVLYRRL